ncbi:hypothetical protein [Mucisphaera sp.]|uniref:hypothetical protein n=1 Tax=Mucisphaera sp. TaxID=2913024 RepID=UPI003D14BB23
MIYRVEITHSALSAIQTRIDFYRSEKVSEITLSQWMQGLFDRISSLQNVPEAYPVAEKVSQHKAQTIRRMNHRELAIYDRVKTDQHLVEILAIRNGRQRPGPI